MFDTDNIIVHDVKSCYPDNIDLFLNNIYIKGYFCNNQPYRVITGGFIYDISVITYAIMTYNYKFYISEKNNIHDSIFEKRHKEFKDIIINGTIRQTECIKQQGRIFIYTINKQQGSYYFKKYKILLIILWKNDYETWINNYLFKLFPDCDKYLFIDNYNKPFKVKNIKNIYNNCNRYIYHPLDKIDIIAKYHYYRYIGD